MKEADLWCPLCNDVQCVFFVSLLARKSYTFSRSVFVGEHVLIQTHTWPHTSPQLHWLPNISVSFELWFMFLPFLGVLFWPCSPTNQQAEFPWAMAAMASGHGYSASIGASVIELDDGKIYRKALYLMVKTMVSCRFSLKPIHWIRYILPDGTIDPLKMGIPRSWDACPQDGTPTGWFLGDHSATDTAGLTQGSPSQMAGDLFDVWPAFYLRRSQSTKFFISSRCFLFSKSWGDVGSCAWRWDLQAARHSKRQRFSSEQSEGRWRESSQVSSESLDTLLLVDLFGLNAIIHNNLI